MLRLAYFGSPTFAADFLNNLVQDTELPIEIALVVTQPDKPVGRKQILTPCAVKTAALSQGLELWDKSLKSEDHPSIVEVMQEKQIDLALLFAYGEIIKNSLLEAPKFGFWNIHPSLLPLYRGASPTAYPLIIGDKVTGITLMQMDAKLDHGDIIDQEVVPIIPKESRGQLEHRLTSLSYLMFKKNILHLASQGSINKKAQLHETATFTRQFSKEDGYIPAEILRHAIGSNSLNASFIPPIIIDYSKDNNEGKNAHLKTVSSSAELIYRLFLGLNPWPGLWTLVTIKDQQKRLKITDVDISEDGKLIIQKVQLEGKNEVDFETFEKAYHAFS